MVEESITVGQAPSDDDNMTLVALTPADMAPTQGALVDWCDRKIAAVKRELADLEENHEVMNRSGIRQKGVVAAITRTERRITYYEKIRACVSAGYLIVPNFPTTLFAVRVNRERQPVQERDSKWGGFPATPQLLPPGEGRYVDDQLTYEDLSRTERLPDGKERHIRLYQSDEYTEVDFPFKAVKPAVLKATERAMALKIFDQLGIVQNVGAGDPIVVGQLLDPRGNRRMVTFFVAWWLDTATL